MVSGKPSLLYYIHVVVAFFSLIIAIYMYFSYHFSNGI